MSKLTFILVLISSIILVLTQNVFIYAVTLAVGFYIRHKLRGLNLGVR